MGSLTREELEAEVLRLRGQQAQVSGTAFGRPVRSTPIGHDELFWAIEKTRMPMILTDPGQPDEPIVFANRAFQQLSGYGADELLGRNCRFLQGPDTDPEDVQSIRDALDAKRDLAVDILNYRKDGTPFLNELYISPVVDGDGQLLYNFGSQVDVTGYRKDRKALEASEQRQRSIFDSALDFAIVVTDRDGVITDWNGGAEQVMGWTAEEMRGQDASRFFTPEDNANGRVTYEMETSLRDGRATDERWHLKKGGERFWASGEMMPLRDPTNAHIGFIKILRDRTLQRQTGEQLRKSQERFQALLEGIETAFAIVEVKFDPDGRPVNYRFLEANPAFERQAGVDLRGKWVTEFAPDLERFWFETYGRVASTGEPANFESYAEAFGRWFDVRAIRVGEPSERQIAIFFNDVTAKRQVQARNAATLELNDRLAGHEDAAGLADVASEVIGRTLGVELVDYGVVDAEAETITVERGWTSGPAQPLAGRLRFRDFGSYIEDLKRGETVVVNDVRSDARTAAHATALEDRGARAFVNAPVFEHGRFVAMLYVLTDHPREWTEDEQAFIREIALRTRTATARRQAEVALRSSETELRLVTDALPFLVSFVDRSLTYRFANTAYREWFGCTPEQVVGRTIPEIAGEHGYAMRRTAIERALAGEAVQLDLDWPWQDGRRRIADIRYLPRRDVRGDVDGFYVFVQDVTALRDAAEVLSHRAETLTQQVAERTAERDRVWEVSRDLLLVSDLRGVWLNVNPAWTSNLGWTTAELLGRTSEWIEHPDDQAKTRAEIARLAEGETTFAFENRFRTRDDDYRTLAWTAVIADDKIFATARDVTDERAQTAALLHAEDALRQSQKMEAVGQLTGGVAHDFNNLLTIIRSSVDFLRRPDLPAERRKRYMDAVSDTVERAAKLTGQLLAFARRQALKPEVLNVGERLRAVADMIDTVTGARVRVVPEIPDTSCFIRADLSQFETALINMAVNARDAMDGEGTLTLRLTCGVPIPQIRGHASGPQPFAKIELSDTGSGIAAEDLARIFEPFFTTKEVGKGTGLGLSQVFGFAKQSGGDVDVRSAVGRGTTFALYLPQVDEAADQDLDDEEGGLAPGGGGLRVLVVEDNIEVGQFATQILDDLGYRSEWAPNAETALERLDGDGNGFDAVFSDVVMPGMGGIALAEELRRRLPRLPVVLASGYSHVLAQDDAHGFDLLNKPYSADQLSRVLRRVIGKRRAKTRRR